MQELAAVAARGGVDRDGPNVGLAREPGRRDGRLLAVHGEAQRLSVELHVGAEVETAGGAEGDRTDAEPRHGYAGVACGDRQEADHQRGDIAAHRLDDPIDHPGLDRCGTVE